MTHTFDWSAGYPSQRGPVFARNVVSTSHPLAAQAGLRMLQAGGNAVDAAIATAAVMTIVEPCSNGLGSDAFCILWDGQQLHGLNASGRAPQAWTPEYFRRKYGADARAPAKRGWDSVTVPGAVAGWVALSQRFGKLPFEDLLQPAIEVAERGYAGDIVVLMAVDKDGKMLGARVLKHVETPGLGDKIEVAKAPWIKSFDGKSLGDPAPEKWAVKKDNGIFDQFAGATITPRAVVKSVKGGLEFFAAHRAEILEGGKS